MRLAELVPSVACYGSTLSDLELLKGLHAALDAHKFLRDRDIFQYDVDPGNVLVAENSQEVLLGGEDFLSDLDPAWMKPDTRRKPPRFVLAFLFYTCLLALVAPVYGIWPFSPKRFTGNALLTAGRMGVDDDGRVIAFGDFNGDQFSDIITLGSDQHTLSIYLWNHEKFHFTRTASFRHPQRVYNVVPGDFTHDGTLDILVMSQSPSSNELAMSLYPAKSGGGFDMDPIYVPPSTLSQPIPLDIDGDMKIDLLGLRSRGSSSPKIWQNIWNVSEPSHSLYTVIDPPFKGIQCKLSNPHSNAFIDLNGDCLADIFLVCDDSSGQKSFQIWVNNKDDGFSLAQSERLPQGTQSVTFADMDRDGTIDLLITTCTSVSSRTGLGTGCSLNIAYNKQLPLCTSSSSALILSAPLNESVEDGQKKKTCRRPDELCSADPNFRFDFEGTSYVSLPISTLLPSQSSRSSLLVLDTSFSPPLPVPPRLGDANLDGFPDLLIVTSTTVDHARRPRLIYSDICGGKGVMGCDVPGARRGWKEVKKNADALGNVSDARGVAFLDMDEDGTLDIMVQRTGEQGQGNVLFVQNNFYYDAFFMKAIVLNGACISGWCTPSDGSERYRPFGVSYSGASYKYTVLDTSGRRSAAQGIHFLPSFSMSPNSTSSPVAQLPQTSYQSLQTPYVFFGLGRTNNYIENLFAGSTKHTAQHFINLEMVIPNSKIVINPSETDDVWRKELYLRPGEWIPWVGVSVIATTVGLAGVVLVLHLNEKREDELERRRASHHINFDALPRVFRTVQHRMAKRTVWLESEVGILRLQFLNIFRLTISIMSAAPMSTPKPPSQTVAVYCASSTGKHPAYRSAAVSLGHALAAAKRALVYGGGLSGIMGIVSGAVLEGGGDVTGVIPFAMAAGGGEREKSEEPTLHVKLNEKGREKIVVQSMHERKVEMAKRAGGFIGLPGGFGTFEEILEVTTWSQLGIHSKPVVLVNVLGFFEPLRAMIQRAVSDGFIQQHNEHLIVFVDGPADQAEHETFDWGSAALTALDGWCRGAPALFDWTVKGGLEVS
ncbi:hypothetical protein EW146_g3775 [Bondarzewia mesenterica]|uniref:T-cell immunomodulatory protein TIP C2 domain-containing protein n=1 Tax=Bondarzewia mesenterica TaxID=1095465 RepID=A0A4S4M2B6_9AGAM|nr:hypothetical protein EW146_g3775 [Bondarzewia mesenterica]